MPPGVQPPLRRPKIGFPAPLDLLWDYRRREPNDVIVVKAMRAACLWRRARPVEIAKTVLRYAGSLIRLPVDLARYLLREGPAARRRYGRSFVGQASDMLLVAHRNGVRPRDYYFAGLARIGGRPELGNYLTALLFADVSVTLSRAKDMTTYEMAKNKLRFEARCRAAGLPVIPSLLVVTKGEEPSLAGLPQADLILKPVAECRGYGVEGWDYGAGVYRHCGSDEIRTPEQLIDRAKALAECYGQMLVQKRIRNHPDLAPFAGSALATTRVVTLLNEDGEPEIADVFFRTSALTGAVVDNFHSGGVIFPIDPTSGEFRPGFANASFNRDKLTHHPETGMQVAGRVHPAWSGMADLARRLHAAFPGFVIAGWDIAYSTDGLILTEANSAPEISINRQGTMNGLVGTRLLGLLAYHAGRWLIENEPVGSRWRPLSLAEKLQTVGNRPGSARVPRP